MANALDKPPAKRDDKPATSDGQAPAEAPRGWLSWIVGWVLVPGAVLGLIFGGGAMLGAHNHDGWYTRLVLWVAGWF